MKLPSNMQSSSTEWTVLSDSMQTEIRHQIGTKFLFTSSTKRNATKIINKTRTADTSRNEPLHKAWFSFKCTYAGELHFAL